MSPRPGRILSLVLALFAGARIFRVHEVRPNRLALDSAWALTPEESDMFAT